MKLKTALLVLCIMVVHACLPAPQVTVTPEATLTLTPLPTETPIPTKTEAPTATATEVVSETAISTVIEGNPFSETGIELKMLNSEITLSTEGDDLMYMADILDQLAAEGKITVKPVTDQRGAMQLGPSADGEVDLVMQDEATDFVKGVGWQPMFLVQDYDLRTYRWQDVTTRPVLVGFNNADGGVIFATMMVDGSGDLKVTDWRIAPDGWNSFFGDELIDSIVNYDAVPKMSLKKTIPVPVDFADVDACIEYAMDEGMRATCEEIVANRSKLRAAYKAMISTGTVQKDLRSGKLLTLLGFTPAHR